MRRVKIGTEKSYRRKKWVPYENGVDGVKVKTKLHSSTKPIQVFGG